MRTFEMRDCVPALTPMRPGTRLTKDQSDLSPDLAFHRRHRGIVGSLGYLVNMTRPDLAWSYSELSKYVQYPGKAHMDAALHVLRYLRGTFDQAILYQHVDELANTLWGWVDSDWAADVDSRQNWELSYRVHYHAQRRRCLLEISPSGLRVPLYI